MTKKAPPKKPAPAKTKGEIPIKPKKPAKPSKPAAAKKPAKVKQPAKPIPKYHIDHKIWDKPAAMAKICAELITTSYSIHNICKRDPELPSVVSVFSWFDQEIAAGGETPLLNQYARAKEAQADYLADEIMEISDDGSNDWMEKAMQDGSVVPVVDHEHIQRSKLRVEARKWIASKLKPKKYGDKLELGNSPENPFGGMGDKELNDNILALMRKLRTDES